MITFRSCITGILFFGTLTVFGQLLINAPTTDFKLPIFNDEGYRHWYMIGDEALYVNESEVRIQGLELQQYSGDDRDIEIGSLRSPQATFYVRQQTASGPSTIDVQSETFRITGEDWIWQAEENRIIINRNVRVLIFDSVGNLIK